jgi:hypothetical protein
MSFPLTPANNQVTLENGIAYTYNASRGAWFRTPATALASLTSNTFTVLNSIIFSDGTSQTSAASPNDLYARTTANTATNNITILQGVNTDQNNRITIAEGVDVGQNTRMSIIEGVNATQNTDITAANTRAQAAFNTANSALSQSNSALTAISAISSIRVSTSNTTPVSANVGDQWYYPPTDTIYRFTNDGVKNWWIDVSGISIQNNDIPLRAPGAPTSVSATATSNGTASISFTAPTDTGFPVNAITSYTVTSNTGISVTGSSSPLTIVGLTPEIGYTFTVVATNRAGSGVASANTNSIVALGAPPTQVTYAVQGGGGGSGGGYPFGWAGGGGAGGIYRSGTMPVSSGSTYSVTIGGGGSAGSVSSPSSSTSATAGTSSVFHSITATGGGAGQNATPARGGNNADYSGGGAGGNSYSGSGGAGSAGNGSPQGSTDGGPGGSGTYFSAGAFYVGGGGGGGGSHFGPGQPVGPGGSPGNFGDPGGQGGPPSNTAGTANRGGGGGGAAVQNSNGRGGGSGIVSVTYPTQFASAVSSPGASYTVNGGTRTYIWNSSGSISF